MDTALNHLLVGRGVDSGAAATLAAAFTDWQTLAAVPQAELAERFGPAVADQVAAAKERREIPRDTVRRLMDDCDSSCCYCWAIDRRIGVLLHHIEDHARSLDDSYENLVVLCPSHHSEVHRRYTIARHPYSPEAIKLQKARFAAAVAEFRAGKRPAPGREDSAPKRRRATAPLPPKNFVGRAEAIAEIRAQLLGAEGRIAIVGMGGVGKTALALQAVHELKAEFPGGTYWLESDVDGGSRRILRGIIAALGGDDAELDEEEQATLAQDLLSKQAASVGRLLLAVDGVREPGLDHLRRAVTSIPGTVSFLMTTRDTSAAVALDARVIPLEPLPRIESGKLLATRSGNRATGNAPDGERLLDLLGDLPLAVELVACQISILSGKPGFTLAGLCERLERFDNALLSFPGHRGIARSFALSYESMNPSERRLFRALGVFAEGLFATDAAAMIADMQKAVAAESMDRLVGISILQWDTEPGHYRAHTLVHKYAGYLLEQSAAEEQRDTGTRHRLHFIAAANSVAARLPPDMPAIDRVWADYTKAMHSAARAGEAAAVAESMSIVWKGGGYFTSHPQETGALSLLEIAVGCAEKLDQPDLLAELLAHRGRALLQLCRLKEGMKLYERAIKLSRRTGNLWDLSSHLQNLGLALVSESRDLKKAERVLRESVVLAERTRNIEAATAAMGSLGALCRHAGRLPEAADMYERALRLAQLSGNRFSEGIHQSNLGLAQLEQQNFAEAEKSIRKGLEIALEVGDRRGEGNRTGHLGRIMLEHARRRAPGLDREACFADAIKAFQTAA